MLEIIDISDAWEVNGRPLLSFTGCSFATCEVLTVSFRLPDVFHVFKDLVSVKKLCDFMFLVAYHLLDDYMIHLGLHDIFNGIPHLLCLLILGELLP